MARQKKSKGFVPADAKSICENRRAGWNYELGETFEAGLVLQGTEVKSCRAGKAHLNDAYVRLQGGEAFLIGSHIAEYGYGGHFNHEPGRERKLLMNRRELDRLSVRVNERGFVLVPLALYFKNGRVKLALAVAKGKAQVDKRHSVKERQVKREMSRIVRGANR